MQTTLTIIKILVFQCSTNTITQYCIMNGPTAISPRRQPSLRPKKITQQNEGLRDGSIVHVTK